MDLANKKSKEVLVDLTALKDIYCGLGQMALSYARYFEKNYKKESAGYSLTLLVPENMIGKFGNEVKYLSSSNRLTRKLQFLFLKFDVWHSVHQLSRYKPFHSNTKQILTFHDLNYLYEKKGLRRFKKHLQIQQKVNRADKIVCISQFAKDEIESKLNLKSRRCDVIYNNLKRLDEEEPISPNINIQSPFFFTIGVIQKKKNFHVLLDLMKKFPEKHLYIAGKEKKKKKKNKYAKMIKERILNENITNVTMMGAISDTEKIWMYKNCETFLYPSLFEGFGLPIIEAMQFGKPVFSSPETSLKEIGGDFAFFWENFDADHMKSIIDQNLEKFYNDKSFVENEIKYAVSFTTDKHFEEYTKLYESI